MAGERGRSSLNFCRSPYWINSKGLIRIANIQEYDGGYIFSGIQLTSKGVANIQAKATDSKLGDSIEKKVSGNRDFDTSVYTIIGSFVGGRLDRATQTMPE